MVMASQADNACPCLALPQLRRLHFHHALLHVLERDLARVVRLQLPDEELELRLEFVPELRGVEGPAIHDPEQLPGLLRSRLDPPLDWGNPESLRQLAWHVTGRQYQNRLFQADVPRVLGRLGGIMGTHLPAQFGWVAWPLGALGAALANKAIGIHAVYLIEDEKEKLKRFEGVAKRAEEAMALDTRKRQANATVDSVNSRLSTLTSRERQVMELVLTGKFNKVIADELAKHGAAGVPLYLVYPAKGGAPKKLDQLLTPGMIETAVRQAAGTL